MGSNAQGHRYRSRSPLPAGSRSTHHDRRRSRSRSERLNDKRERRHGEGRDRHRERSRSRDRERDRDRDRHRRRHQDRDRSADRNKREEGSHHRHHHRHRTSRSHSQERSKDEPPKPLPFGSRQLSRSDYHNFEPLFAHYLDIQKQLFIDDLDDHELRGRWKSFVNKWNRGELAEGWYDPQQFANLAKEAAAEGRIPRSITEPTTGRGKDRKERGLSTMSESGDGNGPESTARPSIETTDTNPPLTTKTSEDGDSEQDSDYGPTLPGQSSSSSRTHAHGPTIPSLADLTLHRETLAEERHSQRASSLEALRAQRKADQALQKQRLDDLVPRADAGTRERRLEKRKELNEKLKGFREPSPGGEVAESDLMGEGDGGGLDEYKRMMKREEVKKTERQLRREEMERVKAAEREKRIRQAKEREDKVMEGLRALAKARFG
ncbi:hypothetical protein QBC32DRAFT_330057 [Pseudoneurospora amorphoporcata]|uniref:RNA helicase HEL117 n=1 Tax=Pseudoneurospora amorphoporcata TaxID=241081 RepID=A0AAN6P347_9PEZI|nr:hypothetical protein QBC32DRAFT_330057 [Pseudoneurospora amorphoporcata]